MVVFFCFVADVVRSKPSIALTFGRITKHYMWAKIYSGETAEGVRLVSLGEYRARCQSCGAIYWEAEHLYGSSTEVPFWCCGRSIKSMLSDRGVLRPIRDERVHNLYNGDGPEAVHFRRHIRGYNVALSTAIPVASESNPSLAGKKILAVNGMVYRKAPSYPNLQPDGLPRHHGQLFFVDFGEDVIQRRLQASTDPELRRDVLELLERYLRANNDFIRTFQFASEVQKEIERNEPGDAAEVCVVVNPHRTGFRTTDRYV